MAVRSLVYYLLTAWSQRIYLALHRHASPSTSIHFICHSTNTLHTNINALAEAQKKPTKSERWQFAALSAEVQPHTALAESRNAHMHHQVAHRYVFEWPHGMHSECDLNRSHSHSFVRLNSPTGSMQQFERVVCCRVRRAAWSLLAFRLVFVCLSFVCHCFLHYTPLLLVSSLYLLLCFTLLFFGNLWLCLCVWRWAASCLAVVSAFNELRCCVFASLFCFWFCLLFLSLRVLLLMGFDFFFNFFYLYFVLYVTCIYVTALPMA